MRNDNVTIISFSDPSTRFDFDREAKEAAINEACAGADVECTIDRPCDECQALAQQIKSRLIRAFLAGQNSLSRGESGNE